VEQFTPGRRQFQLISETSIDYVDLTDSHDGRISRETANRFVRSPDRL